MITSLTNFKEILKDILNIPGSRRWVRKNNELLQEWRNKDKKWYGDITDAMRECKEKYENTYHVFFDEDDEGWSDYYMRISVDNGEIGFIVKIWGKSAGLFDRDKINPRHGFGALYRILDREEEKYDKLEENYVDSFSNPAEPVQLFEYFHNRWREELSNQ